MGGEVNQPPQTREPLVIEKLIVIGYDAAGQLALECRPGLNPADAVIILEQLRQTIVGQFQFRKERKIDLVPGAAMGALNGARKG